MKKLLSMVLLLISMAVSAEEKSMFDWNVKPRLSYEQSKTLGLTLNDSLFDDEPIVSPDAYRVPSYKPLDDISWVGIPIFLSGIIAKGEKKAFRQDYNNTHSNTRLVTHFKTKVDDYTQYFGPALTLGLKVGGVEDGYDLWYHGRTRQRYQVHFQRVATGWLDIQLLALRTHGNLVCWRYHPSQGIWSDALALVLGSRL